MREESKLVLEVLTSSVLVSLYPQPPRALVGLGVPFGALYPHLAVLVTGGLEVVEVTTGGPGNLPLVLAK